MNNLALLFLRIVFCGAMIYGHGLGKLNKVIGGNLKFSDPIGIGEVPTLYLAVFSEIIAPIFILVGFCQRPFRRRSTLDLQIVGWCFCWHHWFHYRQSCRAGSGTHGQRQ